MRWILVLLIVYIIPLMVLFKNYNDNLKRGLICASSYVVVMSTIVVTNIYISGLNEIKENLYYKSNLAQNTLDKEMLEESINEIEANYKKEQEVTDSKEAYNDINEDTVEVYSSKNEIKKDSQIVKAFRKDIYTVEQKALIPMRECLAYTENIGSSISNIDSIIQEVENSYDTCIEAVNIYNGMEVPQMSESEYTQVLENAIFDVKTAYELRAKAVEESMKLLDTKSLVHIGRIKEYLGLSDKYIESFKTRLDNLESVIE